MVLNTKLLLLVNIQGSYVIKKYYNSSSSRLSISAFKHHQTNYFECQLFVFSFIFCIFTWVFNVFCIMAVDEEGDILLPSSVVLGLAAVDVAKFLLVPNIRTDSYWGASDLGPALFSWMQKSSFHNLSNW